MNPRVIIKRLVSRIAARQDCLAVALDRGKGRTRKIENWLLVEMAAELKHIRDEGHLKEVDNEHGYEENGYGRVDLWWKDDNDQYWVQVKTIVVSGKVRIPEDDLEKDMREAQELRHKGSMYELVILFPMVEKNNTLSTQIDQICKHKDFDSVWSETFNEHEISVHASLFKLK